MRNQAIRKNCTNRASVKRKSRTLRKEVKRKRLDHQAAGPAAIELKSRLRERIVGQDEAIEQIADVYQMHLTGMTAPNRPIGSFLFLGPTGTGKTRIVEALAECLANDARAVVKIDCGEYQHSHEIAKLIGSPPGYLGHRETHPALSQDVLSKYHTDKCKISFVLFDEIEKASDALWNLLLGILDKATLRLGDNRKVDFSQAMIFMTSNVGAAEMSAILNPRLGFRAAAAGYDGGAIGAATGKRITVSGIEAARRKFPPEFINRADKIVVFKPLGQEQLRAIVDVELSLLQQSVFAAHGTDAFVIWASDGAKDLLLREGTDVRYGARPLRRAISRLLVNPIANLIATNQIKAGDALIVDVEDGRLVFDKEAACAPWRVPAGRTAAAAAGSSARV
jgi:ATP-dependent Clp protease ATP-binding subunit ClpB